MDQAASPRPLASSFSFIQVITWDAGLEDQWSVSQPGDLSHPCIFTEPLGSRLQRSYRTFFFYLDHVRSHYFSQKTKNTTDIQDMCETVLAIYVGLLRG